MFWIFMVVVEEKNEACGGDEGSSVFKWITRGFFFAGWTSRREDAARESKRFDGWGQMLLDGPQRGKDNKQEYGQDPQPQIAVNR